MRSSLVTLLAVLSARTLIGGAPEDFVDPFIGSAGRGSCMPGPCLPNASSYPSPDTMDPTPGGYRADQPIVGFSQLHTQGTGGNPSYGNFLVTPGRGAVALTEAGRASPKSDEQARAYAYSVRLTKHDVGVELAPTPHGAMYRFSFPDCDDANIALDVARKIGGAVALDEGSVTIDPATGLITGGGRFSKNWNPAPYRLYFAARVSAVPATSGTWVGHEWKAGATQSSARQQSLGAVVSFKAQRTAPVYLKIAVSFTSAEQAQHWLETEIPGWNFDQIRDRAAAAWHQALGVLAIDGTPEQQRALYTALWHAMVQPRDRTGDLPGFDADAPIWDDHYTLWDTWKSLFPLMAIVRPEMVRDNVRAFITRHEKNPAGVVTAAFIQGSEYKVGQGGNEADNVIADAFAKKIAGVDWKRAYAVMRSNAENGRTKNYRERGWVASDEKTDYSWRLKSGSGTLAFSYNDYNAAQMAKALGETADYERYSKRAGNWRNVWDKDLTDEGFTGFVHSRMLDGSFLARTAKGNGNDSRMPQGYNRDFYEGTWWEYSNDVPHDIAGVTELMGGREAYLKRLIHAFSKGYIDFGNEPSFMTPWIFAQLGKPYLTSYWADQLRRRFSGRDLPGDDDSGAMSSMYLFLHAGFFPVAGQDVYWLHGARVPKLTFRQPNGKSFTVVAENAGEANLYVQSATLNGRALTKPMIRHADIVAGGTLTFVMGPKPSAWAVEGAFDAETAARELGRRDR